MLDRSAGAGELLDMQPAQGWGLLVLCLSGQGKEELPAEPSLDGMAPSKGCARAESSTYWRQHFFN